LKKYIGAIDQGTTSTRFMLFDADGRVASAAQEEHQQIYPQPGWVEHDPADIIARTIEVADEALRRAGVGAAEIAAIGITNQRETTILWDKQTGKAVANAIVWQDTRVAGEVARYSASGGQNRFRQATGLPLSTYFSSLKARWLLQNVAGVKQKALAGEILFGTVDSFLVWHLTGGPNGGVHITDVTNASRTQLMDLTSLEWDEAILKEFAIPAQVLPKIASSSEVYGNAMLEAIRGVPIAGVLGDQHAALVGQTCFKPGEAKNTYGTGCFMLMNTGNKPISSKSGLLTTVGYKFGKQAACYALEGSIAITGALVQWLRDNLGLIRNSSEIEDLACTVIDNGGVYFVPAFSGLYAPYWKENARGVITGLTRYVNKAHIARAVLEATAFQVREVVEAMIEDSGGSIDFLRVDGGMVVNDLLMQFQSDILARPVVRPKVAETTALGAAYAAGLAVGFFENADELTTNWVADRRWEPKMHPQARDRLYHFWKKAVTRSFDWAE